MRLRGAILACLFLCLSSPVVADDPPSADEVVTRAIAAAGGEAFAALGTLRLEVTEKEVRADGTSTGKSYALLVDTSNVNNVRMELPGDVVVAATKGGGWSTTAGVLDDRPQIPNMARTSLNQTLFPLLVPYSLKMDGVWLKEIREATLDDGREVWVIGMPFSKGFFASPVMSTNWVLVLAKDDYSIVSLEFAPAPAFSDVSPVGIRYRVLEWKDVGGARVPNQILSVGINSKYQESGTSRVTLVKPAVVGPRDPTLFLSPAQLEALEED